MKRFALAAMLMAAPLAGQEVVTGVEYNTISLDSLRVLAEDGDSIAVKLLIKVDLAEDARADGAAAVGAPLEPGPCCDSGFWGGLGAEDLWWGGVVLLGVYMLSNQEETVRVLEPGDVNVNVTQTTTIKRKKVVWRKKHGGGEED